MGARGPSAKAAELKLLEGNRGHRPLNLDQLFRPEVGIPDAPRSLNPAARKAWKRLSAELVRYNLLSKVYGDAFEMLCRTIGRLAMIERSIAAREALLIAEGKDPIEALTDSTPNGMQIQSATYQILNKEQAKLHKLLESFGLRPDAAARVTTAIRAQLQLFTNGEPADKPDASAEPRGFAEF